MYYDATLSLWRSCEGTCGLYWQYQASCFEWQPGEALDTDTLTCTNECRYPKILIDDSQFSVDSVWRSPEFYVDPISTSILEIGSREHPYKSMRALMSELLNHHSNQYKNINIYVKENTKVYIEDITNFIINITYVKITSYSDSEDNPTIATLIPTKFPQSDRSQKSAFNILRNSELNLSKIITESKITDYEKGFIKDKEATITIIRSSFEMSNIEVSNLDPSSSIQF